MSHARSVWEEEEGNRSSSTSTAGRRFWPFSIINQPERSAENGRLNVIKRLCICIIILLALTLVALLGVAAYELLIPKTSVASSITTTVTTATTATTKTTTSTTTTTTSTSTTTTTSTSTTTTTTIACMFPNTTMLLSLTTSTPGVWQSYSYLFNATCDTTTLWFTSTTNSATRIWIVDNVTVNPVGSPGTNLLFNGDFEGGNSAGWLIDACSPTSCIANVSQSIDCMGGTGYCYGNSCQPATNIQFLYHPFHSIPGAIYNITFWIQRAGPGSPSGIEMRVNIN